MMKSNLEKQYEKLMIRHISYSTLGPESRCSAFMDFYNNSDAYYENLCEMLYNVSINDEAQSIWMTTSGRVYTGNIIQNINDSFIFNSDALPPFDDDLIEQLDVIFAKIYALTPENSSKCSVKKPSALG